MKIERLCMMFLAVVPSAALADVRPASLFGDHMVLQRQMPVPVWGTAAPGESITVSFAGRTASTTAGPDGAWRVALPALAASATGRVMTIEATNKVVFKDVLVGEVWVCSGQSNMQYGWARQSLPMFNWGGDAELAALAERARGKPIRSYHVPVNVSLRPLADCKGTWSTDLPGSAVAFGFSYYLHESLNVPVAAIVTCWGSSSIEGWMPLEMTAQLPHFKTMMEQFLGSKAAMDRLHAAIKMGIRHGMVWVRKQPNLLYNAMLHPVIPYACRGMVWYQGEANASQPQQYARSLPLWVQCLRQRWQRDDFHFLAVMLPGYGVDTGRPDAKSWAPFREAQMKVLALPRTGVANTIDLGDARNIHPSDKAPVCQRLALLARRDVYGQKIPAQGPTYRDFSVAGARMTITFTHAAGLKTSDGKPPTGFWLAGKKGAWQPATATLAGETVVLEAAGVARPVACRYAWCGKPAVNLINGAGLPAYPFRTDTW